MRPTRSPALRGLFGLARIAMMLGYVWCATTAVWPGVLDMNVAIRGGIAAFFLGQACSHAVFGVARMRGGDCEAERILRGYQLQWHGNIASGVLVGIGALWHGGAIGFLVAYAALSFAWFWYWVWPGIE